MSTWHNYNDWQVKLGVFSLRFVIRHPNEPSNRNESFSNDEKLSLCSHFTMEVESGRRTRMVRHSM